MERRVFINYVGKFSVLTGLGIISCSEEEDPQPDLGSGLEIDLNASPFDQLQEPGNWVLHPDVNVMLVNVEGEVRAFTSVCTHSNCSRNWVYSAEQATCSCHGSKFNTSGQVIQGPARADLAQFNVVVDGDNITIS